jgi:AbrB family looped-hinge helix DNA binding protein
VSYDFGIDQGGVLSQVTVSSKFQIVIPKDVRERLDIRPGEKVEAFAIGGRIELVPVRPLAEMRGFLRGMDPAFEREGDRKL